MSRGAASRSGPIGDDELAHLFARLSGRPLALAVSGGADSMALMHLVARWLQRHAQHVRPESARPQPVPPAHDRFYEADGAPPHHWIAAMAGDIARLPPAIVVTVDHGLRPESAREALLVHAAAERLGLPCAVLRWAGEKPATGLQDAARRARRALMRDVVATEPAAVEAACGVRSAARVLVMAHHMEDQAETVLMRLGRGSGLDGLKGMTANAAVEQLATADGVGPVRIARPLLAIPKRRLVETLEAAGIAWAEDPSNDDQRFERVRIRKALVVLGDLGIGADMIALSARRLADAAEWIEHCAHASDSGSDCFVRGIDWPSIDWHGGVYAELALPDTPTFEVPRYAAVRTLRQVLRSFGGEGREPELQQLEGVVAALEARYPALPGDMTLGGCRLVFVARAKGGGRLRLFREGAGGQSPVLACPPGSVVAWDGGRFTITAATDAPAGCVVCALGSEGWSGLKRQVPALAALGWPAAAAATLPVIEAGGELVDYPGVISAVEGNPGDLDGVITGLRKAASSPKERFRAAFHPLPW